MTHVENIKRGDFIAITGHKEDPRGDKKWNENWPPIKYSGKPLYVEGISPPFVAVHNGENIFSIDIRVVEFQKLDTRYVKAWLDAAREESGEEPREETGYKRCINCGTRMSQTAVQTDEQTYKWHYYCSQCKKVGEAVEQ